MGEKKEKEQDLDTLGGGWELGRRRNIELVTKLLGSLDLSKLELCYREITSVSPPQRISITVKPPMDEWPPWILADRKLSCKSEKGGVNGARAPQEGRNKASGAKIWRQTQSGDP